MFELTARMRWLVGGGAVVAAVAIVVGAILVLGARPVPEAMTYVPRDSAVVAELRPDLPGDQLSKIGNLLAHFPGFRDQSILAQKIDETLAKVTKSATNGSVDYATQVKPWIAGPLFAGAAAGGSAASSTGPTPSASGSPATAAGGGGSPGGDYVVIFTTDGSVTCQPITHGSTSTESYRGMQITDPVRGDATGTACAMDGRQAIVGSLAEVKAAIDAHLDHQGIDGVADYRTARDRLGGDRLATVYVSRTAFTAGLERTLESAIPTLDPGVARAAAALPAWVIAGVRAEDNALVADLVSAPYDASLAMLGGQSATGGSSAPAPSLLTAAPAHASQLASLVPADTAVLYEIHGAGVGLQNALAELRANPATAGSLGQLDTTLATLGGAQGVLGWVGDAGIVVVPVPMHGPPDAVGASAGVVLLAPDAATASAKASQIRSLLALAGLSRGASISDQTIDGTPLTLIDFGEVSTLLGSLGISGTGGMTIPTGTHLVISIAAHGSAVLIGSGDFARILIGGTPAGSTLADQPSYKTAVGLASAPNDGQLYVAAGGVRSFAEQFIPTSERSRYESDIKPYLAPLDSLLETTTLDAGGLRIRLVLTVK